MRAPAGRSSDGKERREQGPVDADRVKQDSGIEFHIGVQQPVRFGAPQGRKGGLFDFFGEPHPGIFVFQTSEACLQNVRARIARPVDPVAEAHQAFFARKRCRDPGVRVFGTADVVDHVQDRPRCTAMQGAAKCPHGADYGLLEIGLRRADDPRCESRGIQTVIQDRYQIAVQSFCVRGKGQGDVEHPQKVGGRVERTVRPYGLFPVPDPERRSEKNRQGTADQGRLGVAVIDGQSCQPELHHFVDGELCRRLLQQRNNGKGRAAGICEAVLQRLLAVHLQILPEMRDGLFKGQDAGNVLDPFPTQNQHAVVAIDCAEGRCCGNNAFQAGCGIRRHVCRIWRFGHAGLLSKLMSLHACLEPPVRKGVELINIDKYNQCMTKPIYLTAREAAAELSVQPATLYAYVSRGLISSVAGPGKQRRYDASDVRRLKGRRAADEREGTRPLTGDPVLETELTLIAEEGPVYRGRSALDLAETSTLETVATLLWKSEDDPFAEQAPQRAPDLPPGLGPLNRLMMALAAWPLQDKAAFTQAPGLLQIKGAALLRYGVAALLNSDPVTLPVHTQIAKAFGAPASGKDLIRAALVLCADHELNTSAFAARCAASTRAPLHAALISGLGAFAGPRHGAASDRAIAWIADIGPDTDIETVLSDRLSRGETLPGFGHSVYKTRDPRADCLLKMLLDNEKDHPFVARLPHLIATARDLYGLPPNVDLALAAIQKTYDLPKECGKIIFCAGRITGWIAHVLEQYSAPEQIRPRAAYVGERPE